MKRILPSLLLLIFPVLICSGQDKKASWLTDAPVAKWIWHKKSGNEQRIYFRKSFNFSGKAKSARLYTTCDNQLKLWVNGKKIGESSDWPYPIEKDISEFLQSGKNQIAAEGKNDGGSAAFVFKLVIETADGKKISVVSDKTWKMAETKSENWQSIDFDETNWKSDTLVANNKLGDAPWAIPNYTEIRYSGSQQQAGRRSVGNSKLHEEKGR